MDNKYTIGQKVEVVVQKYTQIGVIVAFDDCEGLAYHEDIYEELEVGETRTAYIKKIREDGKIDVTFRRHGYRNFIGSTTDAVLKALEDNNGKLDLNDKSAPYLIREQLGMSKTQFKQAIGKLYKDRKILITEQGISKS
jgi:predicted RNA-binding protein (virulence factor B family)